MNYIHRNKKTILTVLLVIAGSGVVVALLMQGSRIQFFAEPRQAPLGDPLDATLEFYEAWHAAKLSTSTEGVVAPIDHPRLSEEVRAYINSALADTSRTVDPVLCQAEVPPRIGAKLSYALSDKAQVLIVPRRLEQPSARMAVVKLLPQNGQWTITEISCSDGESAPESEFSFEREGSLLKNVPAPLNSEFWHLVFEENGINGHTVPLFFTEASTCTALSGAQTPCDTTTFTEAVRARIQGDRIRCEREERYVLTIILKATPRVLEQ
jgi:hypothetical protein